MSWECAGFAREPAKLEDQVRFLAGTLRSRIDRDLIILTLARCITTVMRRGERVT